MSLRKDLLAYDQDRARRLLQLNDALLSCFDIDCPLPSSVKLAEFLSSVEEDAPSEHGSHGHIEASFAAGVKAFSLSACDLASLDVVSFASMGVSPRSYLAVQHRLRQQGHMDEDPRQLYGGHVMAVEQGRALLGCGPVLFSVPVDAFDTPPTAGHTYAVVAASHALHAPSATCPWTSFCFLGAAPPIVLDSVSVVCACDSALVPELSVTDIGGVVFISSTHRAAGVLVGLADTSSAQSPHIPHRSDNHRRGEAITSSGRLVPVTLAAVPGSMPPCLGMSLEVTLALSPHDTASARPSDPGVGARCAFGTVVLPASPSPDGVSGLVVSSVTREASPSQTCLYLGASRSGCIEATGATGHWVGVGVEGVDGTAHPHTESSPMPLSLSVACPILLVGHVDAGGSLVSVSPAPSPLALAVCTDGACEADTPSGSDWQTETVSGLSKVLPLPLPKGVSRWASDCDVLLYMSTGIRPHPVSLRRLLSFSPPLPAGVEIDTDNAVVLGPGAQAILREALAGGGHALTPTDTAPPGLSPPPSHVMSSIRQTLASVGMAGHDTAQVQIHTVGVSVDGVSGRVCAVPLEVEVDTPVAHSLPVQGEGEGCVFQGGLPGLSEHPTLDHLDGVPTPQDPLDPLSMALSTHAVQMSPLMDGLSNPTSRRNSIAEDQALQASLSLSMSMEGSLHPASLGHHSLSMHSLEMEHSHPGSVSGIHDTGVFGPSSDLADTFQEALVPGQGVTAQHDYFSTSPGFAGKTQARPHPQLSMASVPVAHSLGHSMGHSMGRMSAHSLAPTTHALGVSGMSTPFDTARDMESVGGSHVLSQPGSMLSPPMHQTQARTGQPHPSHPAHQSLSMHSMQSMHSAPHSQRGSYDEAYRSAAPGYQSGAYPDPDPRSVSGMGGDRAYSLSLSQHPVSLPHSAPHSLAESLQQAEESVQQMEQSQHMQHMSSSLRAGSALSRTGSVHMDMDPRGRQGGPSTPPLSHTDLHSLGDAPLKAAIGGSHPIIGYIKYLFPSYGKAFVVFPDLCRTDSLAWSCAVWHFEPGVVPSDAACGQSVVFVPVSVAQGSAVYHATRVRVLGPTSLHSTGHATLEADVYWQETRAKAQGEYGFARLQTGHERYFYLSQPKNILNSLIAVTLPAQSDHQPRGGHQSSASHPDSCVIQRVVAPGLPPHRWVSGRFVGLCDPSPHSAAHRLLGQSFRHRVQRETGVRFDTVPLTGFLIVEQAQESFVDVIFFRALLPPPLQRALVHMAKRATGALRLSVCLRDGAQQRPVDVAVPRSDRERGRSLSIYAAESVLLSAERYTGTLVRLQHRDVIGLRPSGVFYQTYGPYLVDGSNSLVYIPRPLLFTEERLLREGETYSFNVFFTWGNKRHVFRPEASNICLHPPTRYSAPVLGRLSCHDRQNPCSPCFFSSMADPTALSGIGPDVASVLCRAYSLQEARGVFYCPSDTLAQLQASILQGVQAQAPKDWDTLDITRCSQALMRAVRTHGWPVSLQVASAMLVSPVRVGLSLPKRPLCWVQAAVGLGVPPEAVGQFVLSYHPEAQVQTLAREAHSAGIAFPRTRRNLN
ncbi:hypothetical protein KIPB_002322 [Kipferlia bialata]|uniref:Uncharacterized protein n=1 Tax=Kipferlia bialata TaxID=797122 RepID=A0A9K3GEV6_9EUKA|nr:hypothetical protein KIPB_002322 [Kipferlia bialata]|eukprot:g2322.t1